MCTRPMSVTMEQKEMSSRVRRGPMSAITRSPEHRVRGDVLDVERAEAATLAQRGQRELGALWRGQERDPGA